MDVEPYRLLPPVAAMHASMTPSCLRAAQARDDEAARDPTLGAGKRAARAWRAQVRGSVATALDWAPCRALEAVLGTTLRPDQVRLGQALPVRRGHSPAALPPSFGVLGIALMPVVRGAACVAGASFGPVGLGNVAKAATLAVGRALLGAACAVAAAAALAGKGAVAALAALFGAARGTWGVTFGHATATRAQAQAFPRPSEALVYRGQIQLAAALQPVKADEAAHAKAMEPLSMRAALAELGARRAAHDWPLLWRQGEVSYALATSAARTYALRQMCRTPERAVASGGGPEGPEHVARCARWASQVEAVTEPELLARALVGAELHIDDVTIDLVELLALRPVLSTCLIAHAGAQGRPAVRVDTVAEWPPGCVVALVDGTRRALGERVGLLFAVDVEAPASANPAPPAAVVRHLTVAVGQAASEALTPLRVR